MSGWAEECMSAEELVIDRLKELMALNPDHELIRYWVRKEDEETSPEIEDRIKTEMKDRFWNRPKPWQKEAGIIVTTIVLTNYFVALREAVEEIKGIPKPVMEPERETPAPASRENDDIPF